MRPIETSRTRLRAWTDADVAAWAEMNADPRVMEFFPSIPSRAESEASAAVLRERLERDGHGWWVLEIKGGASFAGVVALQDVPYVAPFTPAMEVGWRLRPNAWGFGYATEGARAALDYAFDDLHREEVVAMTARANLRSQRVMRRLGMTCDERDDFEHPRIAEGHPLRAHVLYRIRKNAVE